MSWYSKKYYSEKEIDFTDDYFNYNQFLFQEFFNSDNSTWLEVAFYYKAKHGERAFGYLSRKFYEWKNGNYHLTDLMESRILDVMPKFLTNEAKEKLGLHEFLSSIKTTVKNNQQEPTYKKQLIKSIGDFVDTIIIELKKINLIELPHLRYNVLGEQEKKEILNISKYILKVKLQSIYGHVTKDIEVISPYFIKNELDRFNISYIATFGQYELNFENEELGKTKFPNFEINAIKTDNQYNIFAQKYLAYELKEVFNKRDSGIVTGYCTTTDIDIFLNKYLKLKKNQDFEINMKAKFKGEIGELNMSIHYIPPKLITIEICKKVFFMGLKILCPILVIMWLNETGNFDIVFILWYVFLFGGFVLVSSAIGDIKEINELIRKKKHYE